MLKTMLVGLDGSDDGVPPLELGLRWARAHDALIVGCGVVDLPGIQLSEASIYAEGYLGPADEGLVAEARGRVDAALAEFVRRGEAEGVRCKTSEDMGTPHEEILAEAQRYDLILLGGRTHFAFGWARGSDATLKRVVRDSPRPVVVVPAVPEVEGPVVIAVDGSAPASRAFAAFEASGLGRGRPLHVVSVDRDREVAARLADRAVDYLRFHDLDAQPHALDTSDAPSTALMAEAGRIGASLLVMGAYGHTGLQALFGSTTRTILDRATIPVFCSH